MYRRRSSFRRRGYATRVRRGRGGYRSRARYGRRRRPVRQRLRQRIGYRF